MNKIDFKDYPNLTTPINATNLNRMQTNIEEEIENIVGDLSTLDTIEKSNLVNSINEVVSNVNDVKYNLVTDGPAILTGRKIDNKDEWIKRYSFSNIVQGSNKIDAGFNISNAIITGIDGVIKSNVNNYFNLDTANFNGGNNYCTINQQENKVILQCQTANYSSAIVDVKYIEKGDAS